MKEQRLKFEDGSGDKEFFTIIPNYILNHSTVWDRALYIQMKRVAGEESECWMSIRELANKTGMSKSQVNRSIAYLLKRQWITATGSKKVPGGYVTIYKINNIWHLNSDFYRSVPGRDTAQGVPGRSGGVPGVTTKKIPEEDKDNIPCGDVDKPVDKKKEEHFKLSDQMKVEYMKTFSGLLKSRQPEFSLIMKLAYERGGDAVVAALGHLREAKNFNEIRDFTPYIITMVKPKNS